ncbi:hypothetical protein EVAR_90670_1 [Eumeta japonica]|uniref:Uncharacterized protein n=1 Tax=Eumeta variegata TaxID=151549 RepID=A0A4C1ZFI3_EUMVA|nr:hypothetical protein EVAR_90670_1 [Eumeta japonica]
MNQLRTRYDTPTECGRKAAASTVTFRPVTHFSLRPPIPSSIRYRILCQKAGDAAATPSALRVYSGGDDHLFFGDTHARRPPVNSIKPKSLALKPSIPDANDEGP